MVLVHDASPECALQMYEVSRNISNSYQVIEHTRSRMQMIKGNQHLNIQSKVMVLVHDASSECALQMCEVSLKCL